MHGADALAFLIHAPLRALARAGYAPAARLSPAEIRSGALQLGEGLLATAWQARRRAPSWDEVSRAWERAAGDRGVDPGLHGRFDPADRVSLLTDNAEAFAARRRLLAGARRSVDLATYYLQADETGQAVARDLAFAVARGVRVRLCADAHVMRHKDRDDPAVMRQIEDLRRAGVTVRIASDEGRPHDADHRKLLVVDGESLILGGRNLADHYAGPRWRDVEVLLQGPSAAAAGALFERTFHRRPEPSPRPGALFHGTTPAGIAVHPGFVYLLQCARAARRTIDVENAYYFSHPAVLRALGAARRRGVRVRVFTNSAASNDLRFANHRLYAGFPGLLAEGVELYLRRGEGRTLHSKYFVVDGAWVSLGSSNLDYYSPRFCAEAAVHVESTALGAALTAFFEEGIAGADRIEGRREIDAVLRASTWSRVLDAVMRDVQ